MRTGTPYDFDRYKSTETECKRAIRRATKKFEANIAKNGNKRPFNLYIRSKTKSGVSVCPLKHEVDLVTNNTLMATILNNQFSCVLKRRHFNYPAMSGQIWREPY